MLFRGHLLTTMFPSYSSLHAKIPLESLHGQSLDQSDLDSDADLAMQEGRLAAVMFYAD